MQKPNILILCVFLFTALLLSGCPWWDDEDDRWEHGSGSCIYVSGTWSVTAYVDASNCGDGRYTSRYRYRFHQNGCSIEVSTNTGTYFGTVNGNNIRWTGSYPEDGGITTSQVNLTVSGDYLSGTDSWSWTDGSHTCRGTSDITGREL